MSHPSTTHVSVSTTSRGKCPVCGRITQRSATFYSPRVRDGVPVDDTQSYDLAMAEASRWTPDYTHRNCKGAI